MDNQKTIKHSLTIQDPFGPGEMEIKFHRFENPEAPPQQGREMQVLINWCQSEIECYNMLRSLSADPEAKKQWTARIAQCRDTILKIQSIQAGVKNGNI